MKKITIHFLSTIIISNLLIGCGGNKPDDTRSQKIEIKSKEPAKKEESRPTDKKFNDMARFIAGIKSDTNSTMAGYEKDQSWKNYAAAADQRWGSVMKDRFPVMEKWRDDNLTETNKSGGTLFYPFSGPDFLHVAAFFPTVDQVVMIGLEPIGSLPDFEKIKQKSLAGYTNGLQHSLLAILNYSFFRTLAMEDDLKGRVVSEIDGTLPLIWLFMARTNYKILYYEKVALTAEGKTIPASEVKIAKDQKDTTYYATRIDYQSPNDEKRRTLYYMGVNLSDDAYAGLGGLKRRKDLYNFINNLNITSTYLKSASYLMYKDAFSIIRNLVLDKSKYVLQDDSGMAFKNFTDGKWEVTLFGKYVGPISLFANYWQNDMAKAYASKDYTLKDLTFGIGYQYAKGTSNLILAKKIK